MSEIQVRILETRNGYLLVDSKDNDALDAVDIAAGTWCFTSFDDVLTHIRHMQEETGNREPGKA